MRKVTQQVCSAFMERRPCHVGNTVTDGQYLTLCGNRIAQWINGQVEVTTSGWNTATTRERLNGLPCRIHQSKGQLYLNGKPWDGFWKRIQ